jgi:hypothetical protein
MGNGELHKKRHFRKIIGHIVQFLGQTGYKLLDSAPKSANSHNIPNWA